MTILPIKKIVRPKERPNEFEINYWHPLAKGLVFAGLGRHTKTTRYTDSSLYGNHGTLTNMDPATDWVRNLGRWATDHDGTNDCATVAQFGFLPPPFSLACWFFSINEASSCYRAFLGRGSVFENNTNFVFGYRTSTLYGRKIYLYWRNNTTLYGAESAVGTVVEGVWNHGVATVTTGYYLTLFVNGSVVQTDANVAGPTDGGQALNIGGPNTTTSTDRYYLGKIADPMIWSRALSPSEIAPLADPSNVMLFLGGSDPGLLRYSPTVKQFSFITSTSPYLQRKYLVLSSPSLSSSIVLSKKISRPKERPTEFEIDYSHPLAKNLVFAGLGRHTKTTRYTDFSLYGNHGALTNMDPATDWVRELGRATLDFDGTNQRVSLTNQQAIFTTAPWTVCAFVRLVEFNPNTFPCVISLNGGATDTWRVLCTNNAAYKDLAFGGEGYFSGKATFSIPANGWFHYLITYNGAGATAGTNYSLFANGVSLSLSTHPGFTDRTAASSAIGSDALQAACWWEGGIADPMIWSRVLSSSENSALADPGNVMLSLGGSDPGLIRYSPRIKQFTIFNIPSTKKRYLTIMKKLN